MTIPDDEIITPERIERGFVIAAKIALLYGDEFDFSPMLDLFQRELDRARRYRDQFAKAKAVLEAYDSLSR